MDETPTTDADCDYRAFACDLAQWLFERSDLYPASVDAFIAAAASIAHFITDGGGIEFNCTDSLRKTVSGQ